MDPQQQHTAPDGSGLRRLSDVDDLQIASGYPDIRGWTVRTPDGALVGRVDDLVVDLAAMRVRYVDVVLDRSLLDAGRDPALAIGQASGGTSMEPGHTLLPVGGVRADDAHDLLVVDGMTADAVHALPRHAGRQPTREYERALRDRLPAGGTASAAGGRTDAPHDYDTDARYDDQRLFAARRARDAGGDGPQRLTLAAERLDVVRRQVQAGHVDVDKTVETQRVLEQVALDRDDVSVERRPVSADTPTRAVVTDDEIRIPVLEERLVVEKRLVAREEIIVRKRRVTEHQHVEADLRRERVTVDDSAARGLVTHADAAPGGVLPDDASGRAAAPAPRPGPGPGQDPNDRRR